jgi:hypothetical protein
MSQHRPSDRPAATALEASYFGHVLQHNLLVMCCSTATPQQRLEAAERVFQVWSPLCALMSELEACCPNASEAGYAQAEVLRSIARRKDEAA